MQITQLNELIYIYQEIREMCNLGDYVENKGIEKGLAKGIEETTLKFIGFIQNMMKNNDMSVEEEFDMMQIPAKEREEYLTYLNNISK